MTFTPVSLPGLFVVEPDVYQDERGWFSRSFCKDDFAQVGHDKEWVQVNHSFTAKKGTIRGMHFQYAPFGEIKLVKCVAGKVFDVAVDVRKSSPSFLQWFGVELSAENKKMLYIPEGFAHGFQCMEDGSQLIYMHTEFYKPGSENGIRWNDPSVNINWVLPAEHITARDNAFALVDDNFNRF